MLVYNDFIKIFGRIGIDYMGKLRIITDSASDISTELEKKYDIDIIPYSVVIEDKTYTSRVDYDNEGFYRMMEEYDEIPKTSQITAYHFMELYYDYYKQGYTDLILVIINGKGSATYGNSCMAIDMLYEEHPECEGKIHIYTHDSGTYSGGYGHLVVEAAKMAGEGKSVDEINAYLEAKIPFRRVYFGIYNLKYAGKSGRIPSAAAFLGDKIGIKPIMKIWDHEITTAGKCRGDKKVISKVCELTVADMEPGSPYQIAYGNDEKVKDEMIRKMTEKVGYGPTECYQIGAEVASNAGPKVIGLLFDVKK